MLTVTWTDPRGKIWDLSGGTEGVILDLGQEGLDWSGIEHTWLRGDSVWAAARLSRGIHPLKISIGYSPATGWFTGDALYRLIDEWWTQANSPFELGTLTVTRPDGETRSRRLRLAESPDTSYTFDPGLGEEPVVEAWVLTGDGPWWEGPEQVYRYDADDVSGTSTPFYGPTGAGWPLYISAGVSAGDAWVANRGQGPMWLRWTIAGPVVNPVFGIGDAVLAYQGSVLSGQIIEVETDPTMRSVIDTADIARPSLYEQVSGTWAAAPVGDRVPVVIRADSIGAGGSITATGRAKYARAF
ncbi:hypothetical protein [Corynebacterium provencense]|uniref:hypothetical protein n=1 Tax=Corynebacterium provencense TaxID=1737425 RepID=UPI000837581B|nr:hypothetical protein [Corynebacterium provencense]